ncbi:sulfotransferase [Zhongshania sp.]|uniref:sulfotransferase family protein n=1 Tax=Zhongshania sp. TaxID=1971902 RepID=UPI002A80523A|nr:sulfotransferase [Zhongshania sp.]
MGTEQGNTTVAIPAVDLSVAALLREATEVTGLSDFGDDSFREPLAVLVKSLNDEANLNAGGRFGQYQRILNILINRLRVEAWIAKYPEILNEDIVAPVVIIGLQRTGSTFFHRILAADKRFYAPLWYEVRNPAPELDWDFKTKDSRISSAEAEVAAMLAANPEIAAIHPMDPIAADEDILLLEHSFYSTVPDAFCNVPTYGKWNDENDNTPAYQYLKRLLQFLQWQKKCSGQQAACWLLKTPHHIHHIATLLKVFPDAKIVQTHRDPLQTIPSAASMNYNLWVLGSDNVDGKVVGEQWAAKYARGTLHTLQTRDRQPEAFLDVWYKDTVADPLSSVQKVYNFIGMELTEAAQLAMEQHQEANRRDSRPAHEYTLAQFGLTEAGLKAQFAEYRQRFVV